MASSSNQPDQGGGASKVTDEDSSVAASVDLMKALGESLSDEDLAAIVTLMEEDAAVLAMEDVIKPTPLISTRTIHSEFLETVEFFLPFDIPSPHPQIGGPNVAETVKRDELTTQLYNNVLCDRPRGASSNSEDRGAHGCNGVVLEPLEKKGPLDCVPVIVNGTGILEKVCQNDQVFYVIALHKFAPVKVLVREATFYVHGQLSSASLESYIGREVRFVATSPVNRTHSSGATYGAHFFWVGIKPPTSVFLKPFKGPEWSVVSVGSPRAGVVYIGIVCSNPQPDHCVVSFRFGVVYVSNRCLLVDPWTKDTCPVALSDYLRRGELVAFTLKSGYYTEADLCGTLSDINVRSMQDVIVFDKKGQSDRRKEIGCLDSSLTDILLCEQEFLDEDLPYRGVVVYLFSQQDAIALVGVVRVLINIGELIKEEYKEDGDDIIGEHIEIGSSVLLRVQAQNCLGMVYYCATEARIISDSNEAIVLRNQKGVIAQASDGSKQWAVAWNRGGETQEIKNAFHLLRSKGALAHYTRTNSIISFRKIKDKILRDASVSVTEIGSPVGFVAVAAWFCP